jgi:PAS domain S-box-containing protein
LGRGAPLGPSIGGVRELEQVEEALRAAEIALDQRARARDTAEAALRASEERFRTLAESLPQLVWTCLPDGSVDYLNRQWRDYTGMSEAEPLDSQWLEQVIHSDDLPATVASWRAAVEGLVPYDLEHRIRAADGSYRWFKTRGTPVTDEAGHTIRWFGTFVYPSSAREREPDRTTACRRDPPQFTKPEQQRGAERTGEVMTTLGPVETTARYTMTTGAQTASLDTERLREPTLSLCGHLQQLALARCKHSLLFQCFRDNDPQLTSEMIVAGTPPPKRFRRRRICTDAAGAAASGAKLSRPVATCGPASR